MIENMETPDWTTPEDLAIMAADELSKAMDANGIGYSSCYGADDGDVGVSFVHISDAELLMSRSMFSDETPGSLYDRATASCVTLSALAVAGQVIPEERIEEIIDAGWLWVVHPNMDRRRMGWHVHVEMTSADAFAVVASLNNYRAGGTS